jgi:hypothetical protein
MKQAIPANHPSSKIENASDPDGELRAALDTFETSLAIPIISGELANWSQQVQSAWQKANDQILRQLADLHPKQLKQIAKEDPELSAQVEKLKTEDAALEAGRASLDRVVDELGRVAPLVGADERKATDCAAMLVENGIVFVGRFKKQQVAVDTWFQEAFTRDRGVAD